MIVHSRGTIYESKNFFTYHTNFRMMIYKLRVLFILSSTICCFESSKSRGIHLFLKQMASISVEHILLVCNITRFIPLLCSSCLSYHSSHRHFIIFKSGWCTIINTSHHRTVIMYIRTSILNSSYCTSSCWIINWGELRDWSTLICCSALA